MSKILQAESTLTDRYQTTIPEAIRDSLHLNKRDKITYTLLNSGKVLISRTNEDDPELTQFLSFLAKDIKSPKQVNVINSKLIDRAKGLVSGVEVNLDEPLEDKDE